MSVPGRSESRRSPRKWSARRPTEKRGGSMRDRMYIDGEYVESHTGERFDVINPATEEVLGTVPKADAADVDRAVKAARRAFDSGGWWPGTTNQERGRILLRLPRRIS